MPVGIPACCTRVDGVPLAGRDGTIDGKSSTVFSGARASAIIIVIAGPNPQRFRSSWVGQFWKAAVGNFWIAPKCYDSENLEKPRMPNATLAAYLKHPLIVGILVAILSTRVA